MRKTVTSVAAALAIAMTSCSDDNGRSAETPASRPPASISPSSSGPASSPNSNAPSSVPDTNSAPPDDRCERTVPGSKLTYGAFSSHGRIDPTLMGGGITGGAEAAAVYDTLFGYDYESKSVVPHLATSIESNNDFTQFELTLREGIFFSDGTPFDAQMVKNNFERYAQPGTLAPHAALLKRFVASTTVTSPTVLTVAMTQPWAEFPAFLSEQLGMIVNTNVVGEDRMAFANDPPDAAGVGPYVLQRNAPGEEIVFTARPSSCRGPVCIETLRVVSIPGARETYEAFQNGELDVAFLRDATVIDEAVANGDNNFLVPKDVSMMHLLNHRPGFVGNDPRLREAIWLALDSRQFNERIYGGKRRMSMSLISPDSQWASPELATVAPDAERARQLVQAAQADGVDVHIDLLSDTVPPTPDSAVLIESLLESVGFDVTISSMPINEKILQVFEGRFEMTNWALDIEPAEIATRLYGALHTGEANNRGAYSNPDMDSALEEAMVADATTRAKAVAKVNEIYVRDFSSPNFGGGMNGILWRDGVEGVGFNPTDVVTFHAARMSG